MLAFVLAALHTGPIISENCQLKLPEQYLPVQSLALCRILFGYFSEDTLHLCMLQAIWCSFTCFLFCLLMSSLNWGAETRMLWSSALGSRLPQPTGCAAVTTAQGAADCLCAFSSL